MALIQQSTIDQITIEKNGVLQVRQEVVIVDEANQQVVAQSFHRYTIQPGDNVSEQPEKIKALTKAIWSESVIKDYKESFQQIQIKE